jgi:Trk K+ transport system NAD-binding subunit
MHQLIEQEVSIKDVVPVSLLRRGNLEVVEVKIRPGSPVLNIPVRDLSLPSGSLLTAILRDNQTQIVTGDTRLRLDDTVVALTQPQSLDSLRKALLGEI